MSRIKIGVRLESLGLSLRPALQAVQRLGGGGVQVDAVGELGPESLSQTGRAAFRRLLRSHDLQLTALGCPLQRSLSGPEDQEQRIERVKAVLALSRDLGTGTVLVHTGPVPQNSDGPRAALLTEALLVLGRHADRVGATLALETGQDPGAVLRAFLDQLDSAALGVNFDPGNLLRHGFEPVETAAALRGKVVHACATDCCRARGGGPMQEVPVGQGDVDWAGCLGALEEIGYRGWLNVDRAGGGNGIRDVEVGIAFLRQLVGAPQQA